MLKKLIWKQFYECFRGYFVDLKTGKKKSKAKIIGNFVLFSILMLFLCLCFVGMAYTISPLLSSEYKWLYYFLFATLAIALGVFAGAYNTSNALFKPKDNDLLLSMPIKPLTILISRVSLVYGLCLLYVSIVWLPGFVFPFFENGFNLVICVFDLLLMFIIAAFTSVLSCFVGFIIAIISNKTKNKSFVTVLISLLFLGTYYLFSIRLTSIMESIINNAENVANVISIWGNLFYIIARAANGDILFFVLTLLIVTVLAISCFYILQKNFYKIVTKSNNISSKKTKITYKSQDNKFAVLLKKEFKCFSSSPTYMLNCGLGIIFVLLISIIIVINRNDITLLLTMLSEYFPEYYSFVPLVIIGGICMIISLNAIAVPSISLEGKCLWIMKTLPIKELDILNAKKTMQLILNGFPSLIAVIVICLALGIDYSQMIYMFVVVLLFVEIHSSLCIVLSLVNPNFNWTSEVQPIKQNINVLIEMVISLIFVIIISGGYYFLLNTMNIDSYLQYLTVAMIVIEILLRRFVGSWGVRKLHSL